MKQKIRLAMRVLYPNQYFSEKILFYFKLAQFFNRAKLKIIAIQIKGFIYYKFNCDIGLNAKIGKNLVIKHAIGIVIGDGVIIGDDVKIFQNVTLGGKRFNNNMELTPCYPTIQDNVTIFANSSILGGVTIGENAVIGAHSLVIDDVPAGSTFIGVPAKNCSKNGRYNI